MSVTDPAQYGSVLSALQPWLTPYLRVRGLDDDDVILRAVQYGYVDLTRWFEHASARVLGASGVTSISVSERTNRVILGLSDLGLADQVRTTLSDGGVPFAAMTFRLAGPAQADVGRPGMSSRSVAALSQTLSATFDPTPGGVGALYEEASGGLVPCTFGFSAYLDGGQGDLGFVTAAHCSDTFGGVDGSVEFRQNGDSNPIGVEQIDHSNVCGGDCKWSDAAWYEFCCGRDPQFALIARTQDSLGNLPASRTIDNVRPRFQVDGTVSNPVEGDSVFKIGTTTGWTTGEVQDTCVNYMRFGHTLKCQDLADYGRQTADSGGPVLLPDGQTPYIVYIMGIHHGVDLTTGEAIFSAIANIEVDFGDFSGNGGSLRRTGGVLGKQRYGLRRKGNGASGAAGAGRRVMVERQPQGTSVKQRTRVVSVLIAAAGGVGACAGEERIPVTAVIETPLPGFGVELVIPDTVDLGALFEASFLTYGGGCIRPGGVADMEIRQESGGLTFLPWDYLVGEGATPLQPNCADDLQTFRRTAQLRLHTSGEKLVRMVGLSQKEVPVGAITVSRVVFVRDAEGM